MHDRGMTLVEVMISMVILLFVSLALVETITLTLNVNMKAAIMGQAVNVGEEKMNSLRGRVLGTFNNINSTTVTNSVRNAQISYYITTNAIPAATTAAMVNSSGSIANTTGQVYLINTLVEWQWPLGQGSAACVYTGMTSQRCYSHLLTIIRSQ